MAPSAAPKAPGRVRLFSDDVARRATDLVGDSSPEGTRRSAVALILLLGALGYTLGFALGGAANALGSQIAAGVLAAVILALLLLPVPGRARWPAVVILAPVCFAVGVQPLDSSSAFVGLLVVPVAWVAAFLPPRLVVLHIATATAAVAWVLVRGSFDGRTTVAVALWLAIFTAVAGLISTLARGLRRARIDVDDIGDAVGIHFYRGVLHPDDQYTEMYTGVGLERLLGAPLPSGADAGSLWTAAIHPEDSAEVNRWLRSAEPGRSAEHDYRVIGLDGVTRWVRERTRVIANHGGIIVHEGICTDITDRRSVEEGLARARRELEDVVETIDEVVLRYVPDDDRWVATVKGTGLDELLGSLPAQRSDPLDAATLALDRTRLAQHRERALREGRSEVEVRVAGSGGRRWVAERLRARQEPGGAWVVAATLIDVTERRLIAAELAAARDEAERRARTDPLTNAANRLHFSELLDIALDRYQRDGTAFGLVLVDVDRFKTVNDNHGHLAGDDVLLEVAARLAARVRGADVVARWGGEEFAILFHGATDGTSLLAAAEAIREAVAAAPVTAGSTALRLTVSVGAAVAGSHGRTADELLASADTALYRAKALGRNRVELAADPAGSEALAS